MAVGNIVSSNFISYLSYTDTKKEFYTTTKTDEVINFIDTTESNQQKYLNALLLENTGSATLYIRILPSNYIMVIPSGESRAYDYVMTTGIQVLGNAGQLLRWSGCFY